MPRKRGCDKKCRRKDAGAPPVNAGVERVCALMEKYLDHEMTPRPPIQFPYSAPPPSVLTYIDRDHLASLGLVTEIAARAKALEWPNVLAYCTETADKILTAVKDNPAVPVPSAHTRVVNLMRVKLDSSKWTPEEAGQLGFDAQILTCSDLTRVRVAAERLDQISGPWCVSASDTFTIDDDDESVLIDMIGRFDPAVDVTAFAERNGLEITEPV